MMTKKKSATAGDVDDGAQVSDQAPLLDDASMSIRGSSAPGLDAPIAFEQLCHDGSAWTWKNWWKRLLRYIAAPPKLLYLVVTTRNMPTNYLMLLFRTYLRDFDFPNHNADHLACLLRDKLMPARGRAFRARSAWLRRRMVLYDLPCLGIPGVVNFVDARTQWCDDAVKAAIADGFTQVVVIAAGYDTRAYRLAAPGVRFYEVDLPHASQTKQRLVEELLPRDQYSWPEFVGADLSRVSLSEALAPTSFDPTQRTLFIMEGLVYYLPPAAFAQQLAAISANAVVGSRLVFDFLHLSTLAGEKIHPGFETLLMAVWYKREMMYSGVDERPAAVACLLRQFGFSLGELLTGRDLHRKYLPHLTWRDWCPAISPWFGYISAEKAAAPLPVPDLQGAKKVL